MIFTTMCSIGNTITMTEISWQVCGNLQHWQNDISARLLTLSVFCTPLHLFACHILSYVWIMRCWIAQLDGLVNFEYRGFRRKSPDPRSVFYVKPNIPWLKQLYRATLEQQICRKVLIINFDRWFVQLHELYCIVNTSICWPVHIFKEMKC